MQSCLPFAAWMDPRTARLPGILPVEAEDWLRVDDAYARQMAERARLFATVPDAVHALLPQARGAADELLALVLDRLTRMPGFAVGPDRVVRPDGAEVVLDRDNPLRTLGHLVQEDLCILQQFGGEHVLTGAALCFPASWTLAQKIGKPLVGIHVPVPEYDAGLAMRVQRMFNAIRAGQPLWRANFLIYDDPTLHQPRLEGVPRPRPELNLFVRSERQCLLRLPRTQAVIFVIHTYVVAIDALDPAARDVLLARTG